MPIVGKWQVNDQAIEDGGIKSYVAVIQPLENSIYCIPITGIMGYKYVAVSDGLD